MIPEKVESLAPSPPSPRVNRKWRTPFSGRTTAPPAGFGLDRGNDSFSFIRNTAVLPYQDNKSCSHYWEIIDGGIATDEEHLRQTILGTYKPLVPPADAVMKIASFLTEGCTS